MNKILLLVSINLLVAVGILLMVITGMEHYYNNKPPVIVQEKSHVPYTALGEFTITHYTHTGFRTASGHYPTLKTVAVDTNIIPMGSLLYIEGYGVYVALDTGGAIKGKKLDVFVDTKNEAVNLGITKKKVYLIEG